MCRNAQGIAVKTGEHAMGAFMSGMIVRWHTSGRIMELEKKYGITPVPFTRKMHERHLGYVPEPKG